MQDWPGGTHPNGKVKSAGGAAHKRQIITTFATYEPWPRPVNGRGPAHCLTMQKLFIETSYDKCLLQGYCEVMSGGVRVGMTAPYPGLAEHLMLRRELTETDEQNRLTAKVVLERLFERGMTVEQHLTAYQRVADELRDEVDDTEQKLHDIQSELARVQLADRQGEIGLEELIGRQTRLNAEAVAARQQLAQRLAAACKALRVPPQEPDFLWQMLHILADRT